MKKSIFISIFLFFCLALTAQIKTAVYWTAPTMSAEDASKLKKDQLVIVDYENIANNWQHTKKIKSVKTKLVIYSNHMEIWSSGQVPDRPMANKLWYQLPKEYRLKNKNGKAAIFWQDMEMMNITRNCPKINGKNYNEYYREWLLKNALPDSLNHYIDGYFQDNGNSTVSWIDSGIDSDNNGEADNPRVLDAAWQSGMIDFLTTIRKAKGDNFIIITNKGEKNLFFLNDGVMFEKFPNDYLGDKRAGGWYKCMEIAEVAGPYTIFQVDWENLEFGIASSLLLDNVYIAVGQNLQIPEQYRVPTGKPLGEQYKKGDLYCRDYELVTIEVNPVKKTGRLVPR